MADSGFSKQTVSVNVTSGTTITSNLLVGIPGANGAPGTNGTNGTNGRVTDITAGTNMTVDSTDPAHPVIATSDRVVTNAGNSTNNAIPRFVGSVGATIQNSTEVAIDDNGILHLGPLESEQPYPSARFRFSDNTGDLSDSVFTAYGGGYGTLNMASATGTAASPGNTVAGAQLGAIGFMSRKAGVWTNEMRMSAYDMNFPLPNGDPTGQFIFRPYPESYGAGVAIGHWSNTANPANGLAFWTNIAGQGPNITSWGNDTNIDINLQTKGTGLIKINAVPVATVSDTQTLTNKTLNGATVTDATNIVLGTTTGTKIGTATTQKLGFYNATPSVQQTATVDLGVALSNLGLRAAGTAYPITTSGSSALTGGFRLGLTSQSTSTTLTTTSAPYQTVSASAGAVTITLPATTTSGIFFTIKKTDATANAVTVSGTLIDSSATYVLATQYKYVKVVSTTTSGTWYIVGNN